MVGNSFRANRALIFLHFLSSYILFTLRHFLTFLSPGIWVLRLYYVLLQGPGKKCGYVGGTTYGHSITP